LLTLGHDINHVVCSVLASLRRRIREAIREAVLAGCHVGRCLGTEPPRGGARANLVLVIAVRSIAQFLESPSVGLRFYLLERLEGPDRGRITAPRARTRLTRTPLVGLVVERANAQRRIALAADRSFLLRELRTRLLTPGEFC